MKYYVEKQGDKILGKGYISADVKLNENQIAVTKEEYNSLTVGTEPALTREEINAQVVAKIRERYSVDEEFEMINYGIVDPDDPEYKWYRKYVEQCKAWGDKQKELLNI